MTVGLSTNNMLAVSKNSQGSTIITYDDPNMRDEERTYTFNKDGSASCVSHAWGTKTQYPQGTFIYDEKKDSPALMVQEYDSYNKYKQQLNYMA